MAITVEQNGFNAEIHGKSIRETGKIQRKIEHYDDNCYQSIIIDIKILIMLLKSNKTNDIRNYDDNMI